MHVRDLGTNRDGTISNANLARQHAVSREKFSYYMTDTVMIRSRLSPQEGSIHHVRNLGAFAL